MTNRSIQRLAAGGLLAQCLVWAGCRPGGPEQINYGEDVCEHCLMTIADQRYGAQLITTRGRALKFDAVECLAAEYLAMDRGDVASLWVTDFASPGRFMPADGAVYLRSERLRSPMGLGLTAFADSAALNAALSQYGGEALDWQGVLRFVQAAWPVQDGPQAPMHPTHGSLHRHGQR